jgi:hypothetical protein
MIEKPVRVDALSPEVMPDYKNASLPVDERLSDLLKRTSLKEKVAQTLFGVSLDF